MSSIRRSNKRKGYSNTATESSTLSHEVSEHKKDETMETKDDKKVMVSCDDEFVVGLDNLINKANYDLKRSKKLLGKVKEYKELCEMIVEELNICKNSYMKVCSYAYQVNIINNDPEINYASAIGDALIITTDTINVTAALSSVADDAAATTC